MESTTENTYYKICEIVSLKKETILKLNKIEELIKTYVTGSSHETDKVNEEPAAKLVPPEEISKWMGKQQLMDYLKISETTYYRWRKSGKLVPSIAFGEDRYLEEDVIALLSTR